MKNEKPFLFWFAFLSLLNLTLIFQTAVLPPGGAFVPYLIWPPVVFFFLYHDSFSSLILLFFISLLSSLFLSLSVPAVFLVYFLFFVSVFLIKHLFFSKSPTLFFILVFTISWIFPYSIDLSYDFAIGDFSSSTSLFYFSKACMTLLLAFLLFPFLKKYLQSPPLF